MDEYLRSSAPAGLLLATGLAYAWRVGVLNRGRRYSSWVSDLGLAGTVRDEAAPSGGSYRDSCRLPEGADQLVPVDVHGPGRPSRSEALLRGIPQRRLAIAGEPLGGVLRPEHATGSG